MSKKEEIRDNFEKAYSLLPPYAKDDLNINGAYSVVYNPNLMPTSSDVFVQKTIDIACEKLAKYLAVEIEESVNQISQLFEYIGFTQISKLNFRRILFHIGYNFDKTGKTQMNPDMKEFFGLVEIIANKISG